MPTSVQIIVAILGAILVLLGLVTSNIRIFGAEVGPLRNVSLRRSVLLGGVFALIISLFISPEKGSQSPSGNGSSIAINNSPTFVNNNTQVPSPPAPSAASSTSTYEDVWRCIPPAYRPDDQNLSETKPVQSQLVAGILHMVSKGELGCITTLLDAGADINGYRSPKVGDITDGPPLHLALRQRRWNIALVLLDKGANPNFPTSSDGASAHDEACASLQVPQYIMQALKSKGARPIKFGNCNGV